MYAPKGGSQVGSPPVTPQTPQPKQEADGNLLKLICVLRFHDGRLEQVGSEFY